MKQSTSVFTLFEPISEPVRQISQNIPVVPPLSPRSIGPELKSIQSDEQRYLAATPFQYLSHFKRNEGPRRPTAQKKRPVWFTLGKKVHISGSNGFNGRCEI